MNELSEIFSGEILLERQERLIELEKSMKKWSDMSLCLVQHHLVPCSKKDASLGSLGNGDGNHDRLDKHHGTTNEIGEGHRHNVPVHSVQGVNIMVAELKMYVRHLAIRTSGENGTV